MDAAYIYISIAVRGIETVRHERLSTILEAAKILWSHNVRVCIAVSEMAFPLTVLESESAILDDL